MKPLIALLSTFCISLLTLYFIYGHEDWALSGRIAMAVMLVFTAIGHFTFPKGMAMMIPALVPFKTQVVYLTGLFEIMAAAGLLFKGTCHITGWALIIFFVLILPANINAAVKKVDFQKATNNGNGISYLWFRIPLQIFFIFWTFYFSARR